MKYFSVKCDYDSNAGKPYFFKRKHGKHDHDAQGAFVDDAKNQVVLNAGAAGLTAHDITTTQIAWGDDPGNKYEEI